MPPEDTVKSPTTAQPRNRSASGLNLRAFLNAFSVDLRLALRNILRQRRRSLIAIAAIGFGVISMMLAAGYIEWIFWANREGVTVTQLGHIQVTKPGYHEGGKSDPFAFLLPEDSPALAAIQSRPGVKSITPRLSFNGLISHGDSTLSFIAEGIDPAIDPSTRYLIVVEGSLLSTSDTKGILLGAGLAANLGVKTGDTVVLLANTPSGGINAVEGHVRGLVSTSMKAFDDSLLRVDIKLARELLRTSGAHVWITTLHDTDMTEAVMRSLDGEKSLAEFEVQPWMNLADFYNKTVELLSRQIGVVKMIIGTIIILSISNTMTMSVLERTVEIGTAMALGVRRRRILGLFLLEGGLLGAMGGIIGITIGYLAATVISYFGIPMPPAPGMSRGFTAGIMITPGIIRDALFLALVTTLAASIYPSWRASRLVIVDALRHNR
jgi:putative ABC transport system permease protein